MNSVPPWGRVRAWVARVWVAGLATLVVAAGLATSLATEPERPLFEGGARPLAIGPTPAGLLETDAAACATCHADIAAEWRGSLHAASWTDPVFQAAYAFESLALCRNCHAPLHRGDVPAGLAASDGVSCAVCHVRRGSVLAGPSGAGAAPHAVTPTAALATSEYCAACHEFGFVSAHGPGATPVETRELQQSTYSEWRSQTARGTTTERCQGCHMPLVANTDGNGTHRDHRFAASRDEAGLARAIAVDVRAARVGDHDVVTATLTPKGVGHGLPTGDLFRRLELVVWREGDEAHGQTVVFARAFESRPHPGGGSERYETSDTRVGETPSDARTVTFPVAAEADVRPIRWRLDYLLMPSDVAWRHRIGADVNVTRLHAGVVVPSR